MWSRTDDLNGSTQGVEQTTFGFDGKAYVIDLGDESRKKLKAALQPFLTVASEYDVLPTAPEVPPAPGPTKPVTKARNGVATRASRSPKAAKNGTANGVKDGVKPIAKGQPGYTRVIRAWANDHGFMVSPTGRVPDEVITAYEQAHQPANA